jgi:phosphoglycerate dehydrogenase-like enzyme
LQSPRFVIPDNYPIFYSESDPLLAPVRTRGELVLHSTRHSGEAELIERLRGAHAAINVRAYSRFTERVFKEVPELRFVTVMGTGTDNIDLGAARRHGVVVSNTPTAPVVSVAEYTVGLMFAAVRHIVPMSVALKSGQWQHIRGMELHGKTFGFIGLGLIAAQMAPIIAALGMRLVGWSLTRDEQRAQRLNVELLDLDEVLRQADVVSLLLRASPRTQGILGPRELALMKPGAYLVNTGRGSLVDEVALCEALRTGRLAGAALDVFGTEPLPADSPLLGFDNVVCTPHVAWVTDAGTARMGKDPVDNLIAFLDGKPRFVVTGAA